MTDAVNNGLDAVQALQEEEYDFPYHHLVDQRGGFRQHRAFSWGLNYAATVEHLLGELGGFAWRALVDVGCGDGAFTRAVAEQFGDRRVVGADYSERAVALARAMHPAGRFLCLDIVAAGGPLAGEFDVAVLMEVLEHIPPAEADRFLAATARLLEPGGTLLLTAPHANVPVSPKHYRHFTGEGLRRAVEPHFRIERIVPFENAGWRQATLHRLLSNRLYVLSHRAALDALYRYYKRALFPASSEARCQRLYLRAIRL